MEYADRKEDPLIQTVRTHQQPNNVTDSWTFQDRITGSNKTNKGQNIREDKRKLASEEDAWKISM